MSGMNCLSVPPLTDTKSKQLKDVYLCLATKQLPPSLCPAHLPLLGYRNAVTGRPWQSRCGYISAHCPVISSRRGTEQRLTTHTWDSR